MNTKRKNQPKRFLALMLTVCLLLCAMIPAVSAEDASGSFEMERLTGAVNGEFEFGNFSFGAVSEVNGHDLLFLPHHKVLYVYDLDTWQKIDEKPLGMGQGNSALVDSSGIVWCCGSRASLYRYDPVAKTGGWVSPIEIEGVSQIYDMTEANGKLYLGTYPKSKLLEYDPATDTYTDLGSMYEGAVRLSVLEYKDGFIYATANSSKAGVAPNVIVKYDLANKKVVDSLDINDTSKFSKDTMNRGITIVGDTLIVSSAQQQNGMCAVDISGEKMKFKDTGVEKGGSCNGFSEVIVEPDGNEKVYFFLMQKRTTVPAMGVAGPFGYLYEYNSKTGLATPVETFPHATEDDWLNDFIHTRRGCMVTVDPGLEGWEGPSILTFNQVGTVVLYNPASGLIWEDKELFKGDGTGKAVHEIIPGPEGTNTLYMGCYMSNLLAEYNITTGELKRYPSYSEQIPAIHWYDGKCYATGYGAGSLCEVGLGTGEIKVLFSLNEGADKSLLMQERLHNLTSGDGKIFSTSSPQKGFFGGFLAWYDFEKETTFVAVEADKVIYRKDSDKSTWYDVKTDAPVEFAHTDGTAMNFSGFVATQIPLSIVYQDGYVYGATSTHGGDSTERPYAASAVLFAYDVENMKQVAFDLHTAIEGLPENIEAIRSVAADPEVPGKFWGVVAGTLFSFTYDKTAETFDVKEELSFSKNTFIAYNNVWKGAPIYFRDGFLFTELFDNDDAETKQIRMVCTEDPTYNFLLVESTNSKGYCLGEDNNLYVTTLDDLSLARYNTADRIAELVANKAAMDDAEEKIDSIGEVTPDSEAAIKAARAAYDALPEEVKALVDVSVLEAAEAKLAELEAAAEEEEDEPEDEPEEVIPAEEPVFFADAEEDDWFYDAVEYVAKRGIMNGTGEEQFSPDKPLTRAMLMTMLARLDGVDTEGGAVWYEKSLNWAVEKGISDGTAPESVITREQFAAMLYRYAGAAADGSVEAFTDHENISVWALDAVKWAVSNRIMLGYDGKLDPQGYTTRAEAAAMMMRFCNLIKK